MVTKSKKEDAGRKKKVKVLKLNKETIKNLTTDQAKEIKGATYPSRPTGNCQIPSCTYGCTLPIKTGK